MSILKATAALCFVAFASIAQAQTVKQSHLIVRPDANGKWYVMNDVDHKPIGMSMTVEQTTTYIRLFFDHQYKWAGTVQISSDDGFASYVTGHANLGLGNISIELYSNGIRIDPAKVWEYVPADRLKGNGNLWINASMVD